MKPMGCHGTLVFAHLFVFFTMGLFDVERESSMVRWRGYPSIQRDQLELLTMSGDGANTKKTAQGNNYCELSFVAGPILKL